eukprot:9930115-Heterocapsa_arctica.AAC.1
MPRKGKKANRCLNAENMQMIALMARRPFAISSQNVLVIPRSQRAVEITMFRWHKWRIMRSSLEAYT